MYLMINSIYFFISWITTKFSLPLPHHTCLIISGPFYSYICINLQSNKNKILWHQIFFCSYLHYRDCPEDFFLKRAASPSLHDLLCYGNVPRNNRAYIYLLNRKISRHKEFISCRNLL